MIVVSNNSIHWISYDYEGSVQIISSEKLKGEQKLQINRKEELDD